MRGETILANRQDYAERIVVAVTGVTVSNVASRNQQEL
jgi:hypothetical protein